MSVDVAQLFRELEIDIAEAATDGSWLLRSQTGESVLVEPVSVMDRITFHAIRNVSTDCQSGVAPLFIGRTITPHLLERAIAGHFNVLTEDPLQLVLDGSVFTAQAPIRAPERRRSPGRAPWIRRAVQRCLLLSSEPLRQGAIANILGTTQQSVSNAARQLGNLVEDTGRGLVAVNKGLLLDHWMEDYSGPGGLEFGWYSLDPIVEQTLKAAKVAELFDVRPLISGDVAADRLAPWKLPSRGRIYVNSLIDLAGDDFVPAPVDEATLITCIPRDPTLWSLSDVPNVADAALVYWDVLASGDIDSEEAAAHIRELIVRSHE